MKKANGAAGFPKMKGRDVPTKPNKTLGNVTGSRKVKK